MRTSERAPKEDPRKRAPDPVSARRRGGQNEIEPAPQRGGPDGEAHGGGDRVRGASVARLLAIGVARLVFAVIGDLTLCAEDKGSQDEARTDSRDAGGADGVSDRAAGSIRARRGVRGGRGRF